MWDVETTAPSKKLANCSDDSDVLLSSQRIALGGCLCVVFILLFLSEIWDEEEVILAVAVVLGASDEAFWSDSSEIFFNAFGVLQYLLLIPLMTDWFLSWTHPSSLKTFDASLATLELIFSLVL